MSGEHAATHFNLVIERGVVQNVHCGMHGSGFEIVRPIDKRTDSGVDHGSGAHGARFYGHEEVAVFQAVIADCGSGFAQGDDFSMRGGIRVGEIAIKSAAYDLAFIHHNGPDRNLSDFKRSLGSPQGLLHPKFIGFRASAISHAEYCMRMAAPSALAQMD